MPVIWILGCVHKPPFLSQHPRAETAPGTPKNKTKMHLHAPGVELPHDVFFKAVFNLWIVSALPCMAALQEMQGHLMVPQLCSHLTAPPVQAGEGDLFHCSKALALEKSCEKMQLFSLGKKIIPWSDSCFWLQRKNIGRDQTEQSQRRNNFPYKLSSSNSGLSSFLNSLLKHGAFYLKIRSLLLLFFFFFFPGKQEYLS